MRFTEINIKSFGKLRGVKISPIDGINIIFGENETGKSTIMAFILSMLYGVGKGEQRHRYEPWSGGKISGMIAFEHDGKAYALSRQFGVTKSSDRTELWCTTSGEKLDLPDKTEPGEYLLGINRETFVNSVFIGQAGAAISGANNEILAKLTNLAASGDETASKSEICSRLNEAAASLRSRRANAILPELEKKRMGLLEERAVIVNRTAEADNLRDSITSLTQKRTRLTNELKIMQKQDAVLTDLRRLSELEDIIRKKESCEQAKQKYEKLHNAMFTDKGGIDSGFLEEAQGLLEGYNSQQVAIRLKQEQIEAVERKLEEADRTPLSKMRIVKRYSKDISASLEDYEELRSRRTAVERELEEEPEKKAVNPIKQFSIYISAGALALIFIIIGFGGNTAFFVMAALVAAFLFAYWYFSKNGFGLNHSPEENIELQNINAEMRQINRSMRPVLDEMEVNNMEELDAELRSIDAAHNRINELQREKEALLEEVEALREELAQILNLLKEKLYPYKNVSSDVEAVKIISTLGKAQCDHAALEARYQAEEAAYIEALGEQAYELVFIEAEDLRKKLGKNADIDISSFDKELEPNIEKWRTELEEVNTELVRKETELGVMNSDPQQLNKLTDEIKLVSSRIDRYEFEYNAIEEAIDALNVAFESMQKDFGPIINFRASRIVESLTGERYGSVVVSEALVPSVAEPGGGSIRSVSNLSAGTVDQIYLALRLAISGILSEENLPIMLDDAFAQYDDRRMTDALRYITEENKNGRLGQVILFTCHDRMIIAAKDCGIMNGIVRMK